VDCSIAVPDRLRTLSDTARRRGVELLTVGAAKRDELLPAIDKVKTSGASALNVLASPMLFLNRRTIIDRVEELRLPAIYQWPEMAEEGGLAAYGPRFSQVWRQRARMVIRVLRGAKPQDLPVEQPTNFELVINLKTAKAIGYEVPAALLLRADKVIE
jgi:putative ABC transport system substrate-binding protein